LARSGDGSATEEGQMGRGARALVLTAEGRLFVETPRTESSWLTPLGLGAFALGTAIAVPLVGPVGLLALLVPVAMVSYSALLADATAEQARRGLAGEAARRNIELRDSYALLREQMAELHAAAIDGARQRAHEEHRDYQRTIQSFIGALRPEGGAAPRHDAGG
jgi:hypothetical protein